MPVLSGDFGDLLAGDTVLATVKAYVETNIDTAGLTDTTLKVIRLGKRYPVSPDAAGKWTIDLPSTDAADLGLVAGTLRYQVVATFSDPVSGPDVWRSGWFELTAAGDVADLATSTTAAAAAWTDTFRVEMEALKAETEAARDTAIAGGGGAVESVNAQTGAVVLTAGDVGAETPAGAQAKVDAASVADRDRANHTGTQTAATVSDFTEAVQDAVAGLLASGQNVTLTYDDAANTLTVTAAGGDAEVMRDTIGAALVGVGNIAVTVNDAADTITISTTATANSTDAQLRDRATHTGTQPASTVTGLGDAATKNVGTAAGTVAAGNDARFGPGAGDLHNVTSANIRGLRANLAKAIGGTAVIKIACVGTSLTEGYAGPGSKIDQTGYPRFLRSLLTGELGIAKGGTGLIGAGFASDSRLAMGAWISLGNGAARSNAAGDVLTITTDSLDGTQTIAVNYYNNGAAFTVAVDGGAAVTVTPTGGNSYATAVITTTASTGSHTVTITASGAWSSISGVRAYLTTGAGIEVTSWGIGGSLSSLWKETAHNTAATQLKHYAPDIYILETGTNDVDQTPVQDNIDTAVSQWLSQGAKVLLMSEPPRTTANTRPLSVQTAMRAVSLARDVPLLDLYDTLGPSYAALTTLGVTANDDVHLNPAGYALMARSLIGLLAV